MTNLAENSSCEPIYTLSVTTRLSDTPAHSIRQYINRGLLIPFRTNTNRHLFSDNDINRLQFIRKCLDNEGLNIAGIKTLFSLIPCWKLKPCSQQEREACHAYNSSSTVCWEASQKGQECKNTDCRNCNIYNFTETGKEIKELIKDLLD